MTGGGLLQYSQRGMEARRSQLEMYRLPLEPLRHSTIVPLRHFEVPCYVSPAWYPQGGRGCVLQHPPDRLSFLGAVSHRVRQFEPVAI